LGLQAGIAKEEIQEVKHARWKEALESRLKLTGKAAEALAKDRKSTAWKRMLAATLRHEVRVRALINTERRNMQLSA